MSTISTSIAELGETFPRRMRKISRYAQQLAPAEQEALITKLESGSRQDRYLAGLAAVATSDKAWVARHIADSTPSLQSLALSYSHLLPDEEIEQALSGDLSDFSRRAIVRHGLDGRPQLADKLFPSIRKTWGDYLAVRVLAHCSAETVEQYLPDLLPAAAVTHIWTLLVVNHADALAASLDKSLRESVRCGILPDKWWDMFGVAIVALLKKCPQRAAQVLDMMDRYELSSFPDKLYNQLSTFARQTPARMLDALSRPKWLSAGRFSSHAMRHIARPAAGTQALITYAETLIGEPWDCVSVLSALRPRDRFPVYQAAKVEGTSYLHYLQRKDQTAIASEVMAQYRREPASREEKLAAIAFLDHSEAAPLLEETMMDPDMNLRKRTIQCYVENAARSRSPDVWNAVMKRMSSLLRNQPQPVREDVIRVILRTRPQAWTAESLPFVFTILKDALEAPDRKLANGLWSRFILKTMRKRPDLEALCLESLPLAFECGQSLSGRVRRGQVTKVYNALEAKLQASAAADELWPLWSMAQWLADLKQLKDFPSLQRMLYAYSISETAEKPHVRQALKLLIDVDRSYALEAVRADKSTLAFSFVADVIARYHPELLDFKQPLLGRWAESSGNDRAWFSGDPSLSKYWSDGQVSDYLQVFKDVWSEKPSRDFYYRRAQPLLQLRKVPGGTAVAKGFTQDSSVPKAEAALSVLASDPKELPTLLSFASTDRARVATYCAGRAAKHVPTTVLEPMLKEALADKKTKITSKKELVRLIARLLPISTAAEVLSVTASAPNAHRDVITAVVVAALDFLLCDPAGWTMVETLAAKNRQTTVTVAKRSPLLIGDQERYAKLVTSLAKASDDEVASTVLGFLGSWAMFYSPAWTILRDAITDMSRRRLWQTAARSLVGCASDPEGQRTLCEVLSTLLSTPEQPENNAAEEDDLPVFRRVQELLQCLTSLTREMPRRYERATRAVLAVIDHSGSKDYEEDYCNLLLSLWRIDPNVLDQMIARLEGRPILAWQLAETVRDMLQSTEALPVISKLAKGDYISALLAVALAGEFGTTHNWDQDWRDVVKTLRSHESIEIRDLARQITAVQNDTM